MVIDQKYTYKFCMKLFFHLLIINIVILQSSDIILERANIESVLMEIMHINGSLNCITANL